MTAVRNVTVSPEGPRMSTLQPLTVGFGRDAQARPQITIAADTTRNCRLVNVNGIDHSFYASYIRDERRWRLKTIRMERVDKLEAGAYRHAQASDAARQKLSVWVSVQVPRLAELHANRFACADRQQASDSATRWEQAAQQHLLYAAWADRYAELDLEIHHGHATISTEERWLNEWAGKRITVKAPPGAIDRGQQVVVAAAVLDGETIGVGVTRRDGNNRRLVWAPVDLVTVTQ